MRKKIEHFLLIFFLCAGFPWATAVAQTPPADGPPDDPDLVHFGDLIEVDVLGSFEFDWRGGLNPEGFLDGMEKVESPVFALCRSESEIAEAVAKDYSRILRDPKVNVKILDRSNRAVSYLDGAVRFPQRFQIKRSVSLNELIVLSGGITDRASGEISIYRPRELNCRSGRSNDDAFVKASAESIPGTFKIKIADLIRGVKEANPAILSGDIVTVNEAFPIYVIGGVNAPQQLSARSQITLSRAIASTGGVAKEGDPTKVTIFRRVDGESRVIEADLSKIRSKQTADPPLKPYDIVEVPQKGKPKRKFAPVVGRIGRAETLSKLPLRVID